MPARSLVKGEKSVRVQVLLPESLAAQLEERAKLEGRKASALARDAIAAYLANGPEIRDAASDLRDLRAAAIAHATELRARASDVQRAADTICCIARDQNRTESIDGPAWEAAEKTLRDAGCAVPRSSDLSWSE